jgi:ssDNA-binding Zn-finger/Zn-ribbon topoisomerase 1
MIYVTKASGVKEKFSPDKIRRTLLRSGASEETAARVLEAVEKELYDGITTRKLYAKVQKLLKKEPALAMRYDLKGAIMRLGPSGYPFETFVGEVLREHGHKIKLRQQLKGKCATHEIDVVASIPRSGKTSRFMVECKYHNSPGTYIELKEALYTYARFLDFQGSRHSFDEAWLACNTRSSSEVVKYAKCVGLKLLCWKYPTKGSLEALIEEKALYPVTILRSANGKVFESLAGANYLLAKDLLKHDLKGIKKRTGLGDAVLRNLIKEAEEVCYCNLI